MKEGEIPIQENLINYIEDIEENNKESLGADNINIELQRREFGDVKYEEDKIGRRHLILNYNNNPDVIVDFIIKDDNSGLIISRMPTKYRDFGRVVKNNILARAESALEVFREINAG